MAGVLKSLNKLSDAASEIFQGILNDSGRMTERIRSIGQRATEVSSRLQNFEKVLESQPNSVLENHDIAGWNSKTVFTTGIFTPESRPAGLQHRYEKARQLPALHLLDEYSFRSVGKGDKKRTRCADYYSQPKFFEQWWIQAQEAEMKERRARRQAQKKKRRETRTKKQQELGGVEYQAVRQSSGGELGRYNQGRSSNAVTISKGALAMQTENSYKFQNAPAPNSKNPNLSPKDSPFSPVVREAPSAPPAGYGYSRPDSGQRTPPPPPALEVPVIPAVPDLLGPPPSLEGLPPPPKMGTTSGPTIRIKSAGGGGGGGGLLAGLGGVKLKKTTVVKKKDGRQLFLDEIRNRKEHKLKKVVNSRKPKPEAPAGGMSAVMKVLERRVDIGSDDDDDDDSDWEEDD